MELFRSAIRNRSWCKDPDEWLESLEIGNEAPLIAILLEVLTNVTTLKIYGFGSEEHLIFQAIERIRYNLKECEPNKITDLVFNSGHDSHDLVIIRQLLTLQSIHTIKIRNMVALTERNDEDRDRNVWDGQVRTFPNIHNIEFLRCDINPKVMYDFLEEYKNLRTFAYKKPRGDNLSFDPYWLCVTLLAHAKDSLIELTTVSPTDDDYYYPRMRYLHQFNKLQKLHITYEVLCGEHPESHHSISELIPRSIVELRLGFSRESFTGRRDEDAVQILTNIIECLIGAKPTRIPKFELLILEGDIETDMSIGIQREILENQDLQLWWNASGVKVVGYRGK